jgi:cell division protein ZapA (FtsZ GTPase activity inhibitor)
MERHDLISVEQHVTINLFGQPYTFKAEGEDKDAQEVADTLVNEVARVESQQAKESPGITQIAILIIAALNIVSENIELKKKNIEVVKDISERSANLIRQLDAGLN